MGDCQGADIGAPSHPGRLALAPLPWPGHESTWLSGFPASVGLITLQWEDSAEEGS